MKVFSIGEYLKYEEWPLLCDGLTEKEMADRGYFYGFIDPDWMVEKEDFILYKEVKDESN